ncbi:type II toxin-antitoxin system prevent-host-death family antitoxin [Rhodococcus sp. D2-41]|uniref:Antitoxin n=1 Tax=Speluncibacter jeojiensis TaxID=2710754 RepID=A0A9X4RF42_9ACTN|nr:type II toxin-antitoxin system prevent-host-death family antitoxin [Rhodococcus sp. D2-41]MDG3009500.1 type II toxin-antitoxin system prevent-host-death family antitoxin [Rhodococcus sp. D2-41]MDG3016429.1 type II toxin-antitoxin system prevent-host-death family antitoxin [Corynebacteriales bacterium D3-21]
MREMSASEASRCFSAVLDSAERGETIVVTRAGRRVAVIAPAPQSNGAALRAVFDRWRDNSALDGAFESHVHAAREAAAAELDTDPWRD